MFERITIRRSTQFGAYDGVELGSLAEAILFYGTVDLLIHRGTLRKLLAACGPQTTLRLLEGGYVVPQYLHWNPGIYTENLGRQQEVHVPTDFLVGTGSDDDIRRVCEGLFGPSANTRHLVRRLIRLLPLMDPPAGMTQEAITKDITDDESLTEASVRTLVEGWAPSYRLPSGFFFRVEALPENRMSVATNLDLNAVSLAYASRTGDTTAPKITGALILAELMDMRLDIDLGSTLEADMLASDVSSRIFELRTGHALRSQSAQTELAVFSDLAFRGKDIRGAINSGNRSFDEFLPILDRSAQFRAWIRDKPADASLARAYFEESTRGTWAETLPARGLRWGLISLAALHMPIVATAAVSATDSLLISRLVRGWRPNQFIDRSVRPFVDGT